MFEKYTFLAEKGCRVRFARFRALVRARKIRITLLISNIEVASPVSDKSCDVGAVRPRLDWCCGEQ